VKESDFLIDSNPTVTESIQMPLKSNNSLSGWKSVEERMCDVKSCKRGIRPILIGEPILPENLLSVPT